MKVICKNDILLDLLKNYFKNNDEYLNDFMDIYYGRSKMSLRIIDWFVKLFKKIY